MPDLERYTTVTVDINQKDIDAMYKIEEQFVIELPELNAIISNLRFKLETALRRKESSQRELVKNTGQEIAKIAYTVCGCAQCKSAAARLS